MKTKAIYVLALALCAGVVSGCVDEDLDGGKEVSGKAIKFGLSSQKTKTVYDDADPYQINWVDGDQIKIFCAEAESAKSALYNVTPASTAKDGTIAYAGSDVLKWGGDALTHNFYAIYPGAADGVMVSEDGIATFPINHNQKCTVTTTNGYDANVVAKPDMKNALMVAHTATLPTDEAVSLSFKPIMTTLEIVVQGPASNINSSNARVTGISLATTMTTNSNSETASFQYDIKKGELTGTAGTGEVTTKKTETTFISLVDANGNATYVDLANGHTLTFTVFMPPMTKDQAVLLKRQIKVRVHITGNAELTASIKTNTDTDPWTTQITPSSKKKITLPAIPSGVQESGNNWITPLDGSIYVSQMSIPGSHDAATGDGAADIVGRVFSITQEKTLQQQWDLGIRCFDLRPCLYTKKNELWIYHGACRLNTSWASAMNTIKANLTKHSGEFAIVLFRMEDDKILLSPTDKDIDGNKFNQYMTAWVDANKDWIVEWKPDITIDECRGKLILISRYGGTWEPGCFTGWGHAAEGTTTSIYTRGVNATSGTIYVQDYYSIESSEKKFNSIKTYLDRAQTFHSNPARKNEWMINHLSGYIPETFKIFGQQIELATSEAYIVNAAYQNPKVIEYLHNRKTPGSTGILLFDYSGAATSGSTTVQGDVMLQTVIDNNYKYRMKRKGE